MKKLKGIICILDEDKCYQLEDKLEYSPSFSDVIDSSLMIPAKGLAFISLNKESICYVALFNKSGRVATQKDRLSFSRLITLDSPVSLKVLKKESPSDLRRHLANQTRQGISLLSPKVFENVLSTIKKYSPSNIPDIERLENKISSIAKKYAGAGSEIVAHEKDAISLALRISGFTDQDLPDWSVDNEPAPFLKGFSTAEIREDLIVAHDAEVFGDWQKIKPYMVGATEFTKNGHRLTIMNVNRHKVEETLGVDLIMYHHTYSSYVMIQYKKMSKSKEDTEYVYRPTDKSYKAEIDRMKKFLKRINSSKWPITPGEYRLNSDFFYFKLCPAKLKDPLSTSMIPGMYLPFSYWETLIQSDVTSGPKMGKYFSYKNISRYINNSQFVSLSQDGWIGSIVKDTHLISEIISSAISEDRSLLLANNQSLKNIHLTSRWRRT